MSKEQFDIENPVPINEWLIYIDKGHIEEYHLYRIANIIREGKPMPRQYVQVYMTHGQHIEWLLKRPKS